ncbi:hypothetical protein [Streptomyces zaomyceticus]|uniref:hypothetical protein n=1 Tax=Streptomyces zaomyceticus TaxID=68286 RepID=UPI002E15A57A|nr:hypothetical protein OG237_44105 [Streptomyces zaomyceticus]
MNDDQEELPTQRVAGVEYLSCEYCGEPVSQLGTRTPRKYCKRSHRQRAYELRAQAERIEQAQREATVAALARATLRRRPPAAPRTPPPPDPPAVRPVVVPAVQVPAPAPLPPPMPRPAPQPVIPLPDPAVPRVKQRSLFPSFRRRPERQGLFDDQVQSGE